MAVQFVACTNCGQPSDPQDLKPCLGYLCCLTCRDMTRMLTKSTGQTVESLPEFAKHVMRHAARRSGRPPGYQTSLDQLFARNLGQKGAQ